MIKGLLYFLGLSATAILGFVVGACCKSGKEADEHAEKLRKEKQV